MIPERMDTNLAGTYMLIYSFLRKHSHIKAAEAVKKAAKNIAVFKEGVQIEGPPLDVIIKEWKTNRAKPKKAPSISTSESEDSSDSDSSDTSSSSSDSSSSDSDSSDSSSSSSDSSSSDSSSSESSSDSDSSGSSHSNSTSPGGKIEKKNMSQKGDETALEKKTKTKANTSSDSDDSSGSESGTKSAVPSLFSTLADHRSRDSDQVNDKSQKKPIQVKAHGKLDAEHKKSSGSRQKKEGKKPRSLSSNSGSDSKIKIEKRESPALASTPVTDSTKTGRKIKSEIKKEDKSPISDKTTQATKKSRTEQRIKVEAKEEEDSPVLGTTETTQVAKKRRTDESGAAITTATTKTEESVEPSSQANGKLKRKANTPFQRINPDKVAKHIVQQNGYTAKAAPENDYGARAHNDLIVTRGAGFRKEKNKKKRGSYKGGTITFESHSFKFE